VNINQIMLRALAVLVVLSATSVPASAQTEITIKGSINEASCTPTLTGTGFSGNTLTLPAKELSDFSAANTSVAGRDITFTLANCGKSVAISNMWVHFTATSVTSGRINTSHPQVQFQIRDINASGALGNQVNVGGTAADTGPTSNQGTAAAFTGTFPNRAAVKKYSVRYYNTAIVTQAGTFEAKATYTVKYF